MNPFSGIRKRMRRAGSIVFVTGAGVSQESGIPTFRGKDGLWGRYNAMDLATIDAFHRDPRLVWEWYEDRRQNIFSKEPNPGHLAIADLEGYVKVAVLTQNIDGLHQRAGSRRVLELHGSIARTRCTSCDFSTDSKKPFLDIPPRCRCGSMLRPDVVWFGEPLPQDVWSEAVRIAGGCDVMVVAGTSLAVSPANTLPMYAKAGGALLVEVNPDRTDMSDMMDLYVGDTGAGALPKLVDTFRNGRPA